MTIPPGRFGRCPDCKGGLFVVQELIDRDVEPLCPECAASHRSGMICSAREAVEAEYLLGLRRGIPEPAVLLLDIRHDGGARELAANVYGGARVAEMLERGRRDGIQPFVSVIAGAEDLRRELTPEIATALSAPVPPGHFLAVAVCDGHLVEALRVPEDPGPSGD